MHVLHLIHPLNHPEWSLSGKYVVVSPNGGTEAVQVTFWSATLPHVNYHDRKESYRLNQILGLRVYKVILHLICTLNCPEQTSRGKILHVLV